MRGWGAGRLVCATALILLFAGCGAPTETARPTAVGQSGGTLRIAFLGPDDYFRDAVFPDPSRLTPALFTRCCLTRTPLMYPGAATADGGTVLLPDLLTEMPEVARDGLSWTLRIRPGINYAPPHDSIEVTAADFVTAVERSIRLNNDIFPTYGFVAGVREYLEGETAAVSGLETPDPYTLVVRLAEPFGGLDYLADASWAPIPAQLAEGHDDDLGLQWPMSGPYMHEAVPADPTAGTAAYVRNPAWSRDADGNRPALVDRIEIVRVADMADGLAKLDAGEVDFLSERLEVEAAQRYRANASTTQRVRSTQSEYLYRFPMNIALPPFDDVAVRRAVTFAIDRVTASAAVVEGRVVNGFPRLPTVLSPHMFSDSVSDGLLLAYDPYGLGDGRGNITRARTEMARSQYDSDGDGLCDADVCANLALPTFDAASGEAIARSLETIGIHVQAVPLDDFNDISLPQNRAAMGVLPYGWGFDLTGQELAILLQGGDALADALAVEGYVVNTSLVGARPEDLQRWGYPVTSVPGVDDVIERCNGEAGHRRAACWAELDQLVAESVVPWTPLFAYESVYVSSSRVENYMLDQTAHQQYPALDKVTLAAGAE